jgi:hypothetical protein
MSWDRGLGAGKIRGAIYLAHPPARHPCQKYLKTSDKKMSLGEIIQRNAVLFASNPGGCAVMLRPPYLFSELVFII